MLSKALKNNSFIQVWIELNFIILIGKLELPFYLLGPAFLSPLLFFSIALLWFPVLDFS